MSRTAATDLAALTLAEAAARIRHGQLTSVDLVRACLDQIKATDGDIRAWAFLDPEHALRQAEARDRTLREGKATGPLHGVPVGIKDIFDTGDMPTENGSPIHAGRQPREDAVAVARLRAAGAVIMGKTVTTEFAYFHPGKTANPHDPKRTPGGSSSGAGASVAAFMVPAATGSQTNGSVIRPAAFCGVVGYKPTHGLIPRTGVLMLSRALDHVGSFARTIEDAALLVEVMAGYDKGDPDTHMAATPPLAAMTRQEPAAPPRFAFVRTPSWDQAEPATQQAFSDLAQRLGDRAQDAALPAAADEIIALHGTVMDVEMARNLHREYEDARDQLSARLRQLIERGHAHPAIAYRRALDLVEPCNAALDPLFDRYDAILTPAAPGEAPLGLAATGNPVFCTRWTYLGTPAITLPLLKGPAGMPLGVQLVGRRGDDARLLRTAGWLARHLGQPGIAAANR